MSSAFEKVNALVRKKYPNYADAWDRARAEFGEPWEREVSELILAQFGDDETSWQAAVDGYATFCTDALRSQIFFERNGRYKASSYAEVAEACYHNPDFMFRAYLPGMLLSHFVWPHHHRMLRFFRTQMAAIDVKSFSEVGTGCGMYSADTLRLFPAARGTGYDISAHALEFTDRVVRAFGLGNRYMTRVQDIVATPPEPADLVICQEVLEHLEDPAGFCKALFAMTRPGGHAYITAAINAGHVDHIYLYRSVEEVLAHIRDAGYEIVASAGELAYGGKPLELTPCLGGALARRPA
jgi:SAM-dependent methyltransferase